MSSGDFDGECYVSNCDRIVTTRPNMTIFSYRPAARAMRASSLFAGWVVHAPCLLSLRYRYASVKELSSAAV